jgi:hypothetical protein
VLLCAGCNRIGLGKGGASAGSSGGGGGFSLPSLNLGGPQAPSLTGEWKITFIYKGEEHESKVNFVQKGNVLSGDGEDDSAMKFLIVNGGVNGTHLHFTKKYADADPSSQTVDYTGELTYENDADFKGWSLGGHYKVMEDGKPVDDKWVAITTQAEAEAAQKAAQQAAQQQAPAQSNQSAQPSGQPDQSSQQQDQPAQQADQTGTEDSGAQGSEPPASITGMYTAAYDYNFKRIDSRLWLKQQDGKVSGDGTDANTHEYFIITKGFYKAPRLMLVCHYEKGKHANATRDLTVRAVAAPNGSMKGETHYGSPWNAKFVTH